MATEIERKFLVKDDSWRAQATDAVRYRQGYLAGTAKSSIRVRVGGGQAALNIKSATLGVTRKEYEYQIPAQEATEMLALCEGGLIEKIRYHVAYAGHLWEVDVFEGDNAGLVVAEIELQDEDEAFEAPPWLGEEVSHEPRYYNSCLAVRPYSSW